MKKLTSALLALLMAVSLTACKTTSVEPEPVNEQKETTVDTQTQPEKEDTSVTEVSETTAVEQNLSEKDILVKDIISEYTKNYEKDTHTYHYDGDKLMFCVHFDWYDHTIIYNIATKEIKTLSINSPSIYTVYSNGKYYSTDFGGGYKNAVFDKDGQLIAQSEKNGTMTVLEDGRVLIKDHDNRKEFILSENFEVITEFPKLECDIGHGQTEKIMVNYYFPIYGNKVYAIYDDVNRTEKIIDLDTLELSDPDESKNYMAITNYSMVRLAGKYYRDRYGSNYIYNTETGELYKNYLPGGMLFITDEALYYDDDGKLYKYISENESELIYDGSQNNSEFTAVSEDYFIVYDSMGVFFVDRKTGEETKLEIE